MKDYILDVIYLEDFGDEDYSFASSTFLPIIDTVSRFITAERSQIKFLSVRYGGVQIIRLDDFRDPTKVVGYFASQVAEFSAKLAIKETVNSISNKLNSFNTGLL